MNKKSLKFVMFVMAFGHFLLRSHNFMVAALGSCVKWLSASDPGDFWA